MNTITPIKNIQVRSESGRSFKVRKLVHTDIFSLSVFSDVTKDTRERPGEAIVVHSRKSNFTRIVYEGLSYFMAQPRKVESKHLQKKM